MIDDFENEFSAIDPSQDDDSVTWRIAGAVLVAGVTLVFWGALFWRLLG